MKPRITFVEGSDVLSTNNREFRELPPINQEIDFRGERYKVVGYRDATVELELIPAVEEEEAPRAKKAPAVKAPEKKQAVKEEPKKVAKTTGNGKTEATKVKGNWYNRKGN